MSHKDCCRCDYLIHHVHTHMHAHMQVETRLILPLVHLWAHGVHHTCVLWVHRWQGGFFNIGAQLSWNSRHSRAICILSAVKACLISLGARPSASQLVACTVMSLPYKPYTSHGRKPHSRSYELAFSSKCHPELLRSWFRSDCDEKLKLAINVDNLSDGLWITAIASELHAEDHAVDTPKIEFSVNKILAEGFFNNPSDDIPDHLSKRPFS